MPIKEREVREFVCFTANPDLEPQVAVYEIERGVFATVEDAITLAKEIMEQENKHVQIRKRITGRVIEFDYLWMNCQHYQKD